MQPALRGPLRNRSFRVYLLGNTISGLGTWAQRIGIGWLSWSLTHQTSWVGAISLAQLLPLIFLGPAFGVLLDRNDHRRYALAVNSALALLALLLYALTAQHLMRIGLLCAMAVLLGIANSAYQSVRLTMINNIVAPEQLAPAIAMNSVLFNVTRAVGPALAAVLIARFGIAVAFAVNAASFVAMLCALLIVRMKPRPAPRTPRGLVTESIEGVRYVLRQPYLRRLLMLSAVTTTLGRGIVELMPAFADAAFHRGSVGLAHLTTAAGTGAILGALALSRPHSDGQLNRITRGSTLALGVVICLFGLSPSFSVGLLMAGVLGLTIVLCSVGLQVRLQTSVQGQYRGRVLGVWAAVNLAGPGLGAAMAGAAAQLLGLKWVTVAVGVLCAALMIWIAVLPQPAPHRLESGA